MVKKTFSTYLFKTMSEGEFLGLARIVKGCSLSLLTLTLGCHTYLYLLQAQLDGRFKNKTSKKITMRVKIYAIR